MSPTEKRVGLIVHRAQSREACERWLRANPHPPWRSPSGDLEAVAACSGPFKIIHKVRAWLPEGQQWQIVAEHHGPVSPT